MNQTKEEGVLSIKTTFNTCIDRERHTKKFVLNKLTEGEDVSEVPLANLNSEPAVINYAYCSPELKARNKNLDSSGPIFNIS